MPSIGEKIKELRSAKKMTQEALAQNLNVTVSAVSQWESGKTMPDISMLVPLAICFLCLPTTCSASVSANKTPC